LARHLPGRGTRRAEVPRVHRCRGPDRGVVRTAHAPGAVMTDLAAYRDEFPVLDRKAYLISASLGPISRRAQSYLEEYLEAWRTEGAPDPVWEEHVFPRMGSVKRTFAALVGADPDELAITTNVSVALSTIMSCLDFSGGRRKLVLSELDFPTDGHVFLAQRTRGAEVVILESPDGLTIPLESYEAGIDEETAAVCIN